MSNKITNFVKNAREVMKGNLIVMTLTVAIYGVGEQIAYPFFPLFILALGGSPLMIGVIEGLRSLIRVIFYIPIGSIVDYFGRVRILGMMTILSGLSCLLFVTAPDWSFLIFAAIINAICSSYIPAWLALLLDSVPSKRRSTGLAAYESMVMIPLLFTAILGGFLIVSYGTISGLRIAFTITAITGCISGVMRLCFLKETIRSKKMVKKIDVLPTFGSFRDEFGIFQWMPKSLKAILFTLTVYWLAYGAAYSFFVVYAAEFIGLNALEWGVVLGVQTVFSILITIPGGYVSDRFGRKEVMMMSLFILVPFGFMFTFCTNFAQVLLVMLVYAIADSFFKPAWRGLSADWTPRTKRGRVSALISVTQRISISIGIFLGGALYQSINGACTFYFASICWLTSAILVTLLVSKPSIPKE